MARRGAKGKGWIRLMRVIIWVLAILMIVGGILLGIGVMVAADQAQQTMAQAQEILQQMPNVQIDGATRPSATHTRSRARSWASS